ncbi:MAG TPA: SUMF1/EgtB/PvdO family nonheme iron enzyme [Candidatus Wallbacteria bacterium]|nr:SUMF1/EgtB/PvdO family nonheme iron enzyme [Candidatus Wallbacteria bacterium]
MGRRPQTGTNRVNRGGSWNNNADNCRSANRNNNNPSNRNNNNGFRLALSAAQPDDGFHPPDPDAVPSPEKDRKQTKNPGLVASRLTAGCERPGFLYRFY